MSTISRVWPTALKLGCITNLDMLFLVMGFISLVDEIQFMLISSRHICIRFMIFKHGRHIFWRNSRGAQRCLGFFFFSYLDYAFRVPIGWTEQTPVTRRVLWYKVGRANEVQRQLFNLQLLLSLPRKYANLGPILSYKITVELQRICQNFFLRSVFDRLQTFMTINGPFAGPGHVTYPCTHP